MTNKFKCECCGKFISYDDLDTGKDVKEWRMIMDGFETNYEDVFFNCKRCKTKGDKDNATKNRE